jgi:hypothetical protein
MTPPADVDRPDRKAIPAGPVRLAQAASRERKASRGKPDRKANAVKPVRRESPARQEREASTQAALTEPSGDMFDDDEHRTKKDKKHKDKKHKDKKHKEKKHKDRN